MSDTQVTESQEVVEARLVRSSAVGIVARTAARVAVIPKAKTRPSGWIVSSLSADSSTALGAGLRVGFIR